MKRATRNRQSAMAIVALGSNLGDSRKIVLDAMTRLQNLSNEPILKSSLWRTSPVDCPPDSAGFVNAVAGLVPGADETADSLLKKLQALEKEFGRTAKKVSNEARFLDLDMIAFGRESRNAADLVLPHPRAHLRRFVLQPLSEIAGELVLPGWRMTVAEALAGLESNEVVVRDG
ncbi:MAG: 2-amino-4-hydroxy-6-hydroxymethyldihydropteridine diphosphokinase [Limisphaerales bacterium]